jgi:probable F420-dependent oxidoreductase
MNSSHPHSRHVHLRSGAKLIGVKLRIAVAPAPGPFDAGSFAAVLDALEEGGVDTLWLSDVPLSPSIDPGIGLAFAAARTTRLKLGANIVPIGRNPMLLARELAQLDQLSDGRLLLSIVPGIGRPAERQALGIGRSNRGDYLDEVIPLLRRWWSGEAVDHRSERFSFDAIVVRPRPVQDPLELWLGGMGPVALARAGRLGDGWLGAALTPTEAGVARRAIEQAAAQASRVVDPEHFGMSVPYARADPGEAAFAALLERRPQIDPASILPVGATALGALIRSYAAEGISKFVLRSVVPVADWRDEVAWLTDAALCLQT